MPGVKITCQCRNDRPEVEGTTGSRGKASDIDVVFIIHRNLAIPAEAGIQ